MEIRRYANSRVDWAKPGPAATFSLMAITPDYTTLPQGVGLTAAITMEPLLQR
jgi:hypothetical protein